MRFSSNCTFFQILEHWAMKLPKATDNYLSARHHSSSSNLDFSEGRGDKMGVNWRHSSVSRLINRKRSPQNSSLVFQSRLAFENILVHSNSLHCFRDSWMAIEKIQKYLEYFFWKHLKILKKKKTWQEDCQRNKINMEHFFLLFFPFI